MAELKHLRSGWDVDRHIVLEQEKLVCIRFSSFATTNTAHSDPVSSQYHSAVARMDEVLVSVAEAVRKYCVIYAVDTNEVPQFNALYELGSGEEPFALMFFYRNDHIRMDVDSGNTNKINFIVDDRESLIQLLEEAYVVGKKGKTSGRSKGKFNHVAVRR